jgi:hypothetical protein
MIPTSLQCILFETAIHGLWYGIGNYIEQQGQLKRSALIRR